MTLLPVHGLVLAGGKSSRMGRDKALLDFGGRPLVVAAVDRLLRFCRVVSISGNREDLTAITRVVAEARIDAGPAAGLEAGLRASEEVWALFTPVDVPLVTARLLRRWAAAVLLRGTEGVRLSMLRVGDVRQPTFCMLHRDCAAPLSAALDRGERKLGLVYEQIAGELGPGSLWIADVEPFGGDEPEGTRCFANLNTPADLAAAAPRGLTGLAAE